MKTYVIEKDHRDIDITGDIKELPEMLEALASELRKVDYNFLPHREMVGSPKIYVSPIHDQKQEVLVSATVYHSDEPILRERDV